MFNAPKLTNAGKALYYDNMAGTQIVFTTIQLGSGNISGPIAPMTALVTPVVTINAEAKSVSGQYAEISGHFSNAQLTDGFYFREIGVFAADPDYPNDRGKDILYCYQNAYDTADFIPVASVETVEKPINKQVLHTFHRVFNRWKSGASSTLCINSAVSTRCRRHLHFWRILPSKLVKLPPRAPKSCKKR